LPRDNLDYGLSLSRSLSHSLFYMYVPRNVKNRKKI
jgi:hypothetical protein